MRPHHHPFKTAEDLWTEAQRAKGLLSLVPAGPAIQAPGVGVRMGQRQADLHSPVASQPRGKGESRFSERVCLKK